MREILDISFYKDKCWYKLEICVFFPQKKVSAQCQSLLRQTISQIVKFNLPSNWEQETNKIHKFSSCNLVKASENLYF